MMQSYNALRFKRHTEVLVHPQNGQLKVKYISFLHLQKNIMCIVNNVFLRLHLETTGAAQESLQ